MALTLKSDFVNNPSLVSDIGPTYTITRTTNASRRDANDDWETVGPGVSAFNIGTNKGLNVWEARTNLFLNSGAPVTQNITTAAATYTVWMEGAGSVTLSGTGSGVATDGSPVTVVCTAGTLTLTVAGGPDRVQVELGAFATTYIPTAGATVTRNADAVSTTDMSWHTANSGSWYWHGQSSAWQVAGTPRCFEISAAASARITDVFDTGSGTPRFFSAYNGSIVADAGDFVTGVASRAVVTDAVNDIVLFVDGVNEGTDGATLTTGTPVGLALGARYNAGTTTDHLNGLIKEIRYYNTRLTDTQLEDMSNGEFPDEGNRNYIAITRRTADQMNVKQRMAAPKKTLRDL